MKYMFYNCKELKDISLDNLKTAEFPINILYTIYNIKNAEKIEFSIDLNNQSDMLNMFYNCSSINKIDIYFGFINENIAINMSNMFYNCYQTQYIKFKKSITLFNWYIWNFLNCSSLSKSYIHNEFVTDQAIDLNLLFYNCSRITSLLNFLNSLTRNMKATFQNYNSLNKLTFSEFNTPNEEKMRDMFKGSLISL